MKPTEVKCNQKALEALIAKTAKDAKSEVRCLLDGRHTERPYVRENGKVKEYGWAAYQRALMKNDHTIYVALPSMAVSVSDKPMAKGKLMKIESRERRAADRAAKQTPAVKAERKRQAVEEGDRRSDGEGPGSRQGVADGRSSCLPESEQGRLRQGQGSCPPAPRGESVSYLTTRRLPLMGILASKPGSPLAVPVSQFCGEDVTMKRDQVRSDAPDARR